MEPKQSLDHIPHLFQPLGVLRIASDPARRRQNLGARLFPGDAESSQTRVYLVGETM